MKANLAYHQIFAPGNKEVDLFPSVMLGINRGYQKESLEMLNVMMLDKCEIPHSFLGSSVETQGNEQISAAHHCFCKMPSCQHLQ